MAPFSGRTSAQLALARRGFLRTHYAPRLPAERQWRWQLLWLASQQQRAALSHFRHAAPTRPVLNNLCEYFLDYKCALAKHVNRMRERLRGPAREDALAAQLEQYAWRDDEERAAFLAKYSRGEGMWVKKPCHQNQVRRVRVLRLSCLAHALAGQRHRVLRGGQGRADV